MENTDKIIEELEELKSLIEKPLQNRIDNIIKKYQRKNKRLDKIVSQSDRQQLEFLKLNEELNNTHQKLKEHQLVVVKAKETAELATQAKSDLTA